MYPRRLGIAPPRRWDYRGVPTRFGRAEWVRLGFIVPWREPLEIEPRHLPAPRCEAERCGQRCHHHSKEAPEIEVPRLDRYHQLRYEEAPEIEVPRLDRYHQLRYPLFGREVDFGRNEWEYHAWDVRNDVRIPVGVPRRQWQLQNGDLVQLLGDTGLWAVVLTEFY